MKQPKVAEPDSSEGTPELSRRNNADTIPYAMAPVSVPSRARAPVSPQLRPPPSPPPRPTRLLSFWDAMLGSSALLKVASAFGLVLPEAVAILLAVYGAPHAPPVAHAETLNRHFRHTPAALTTAVSKRAPEAQPRPPTTLPVIDVVPKRDPFRLLTRKKLWYIVRKYPKRLGPLSIGIPNRGSLFNGVKLTSGPGWKVVNDERAWATRETIESLKRAIRFVDARIPATPILYIGDLSRRRGGWLRPHRSHQSGRDVDVGYFYSTGPQWYKVATADNLDTRRTWALVKALLTGGNVQYIFMDRSIQSLIKTSAAQRGEDPALLDQAFGTPHHPGVIRHVYGHKTHMHVRFYCDAATERARLVYPLLRRSGHLR